MSENIKNENQHRAMQLRN